MKDGFIKVAAAVIDMKVASCAYNAGMIKKAIDEAYAENTAVLVFPELCMTGYTCSDLFFQNKLLKSAETELEGIISHSKGKEMLIFVGIPFSFCSKLYNCAAVISDGSLLGLVPKKYLPSYNEFYETRQFTNAPDENHEVDFAGGHCFFGINQLFIHSSIRELIIGAEICEDLWMPTPPSTAHCAAGATLIVNLSASTEGIGKPEYRRSLVAMHSAKNLCGYVYSSAGESESTTDVIYSGHSMIYENGVLLAERKPFSGEGIMYSEIDIKRLSHERRKITDFISEIQSKYKYITFDFPVRETKLTRKYDRTPFVPADAANRDTRCKFIIDMQSYALLKRLRHTGCKTAVVGISGGLDSTLALLVTVAAFDKLGKPRNEIITPTMPCFGTGKRTRSNAQKLCELLKTDFRCIDIGNSVSSHLADIGHDKITYDITYENAQARERTQVLMDIANQSGGIVIGTGDLSEVALGWSTYNGDHMSMYAVNCSVPKTLVRYIVKYYADTCADKALSEVLYDIIDTPVSPELIPGVDGEISQKTEEIIGTYELHDFFLYYVIRCGFEPEKVLRIALETFEKEYGREYIENTLKTFYRRFFSQQFKRSCIPDGVKIGSVALSPRGDWRMPSDADCSEWLK